MNSEFTPHEVTRDDEACQSSEELLLSGLGGVSGALLAVVVTTAYATYQSWPVVVPAWATVGGMLATLVIGACAGVYPAWRAARLSPTEALNTP